MRLGNGTRSFSKGVNYRKLALIEAGFLEKIPEGYRVRNWEADQGHIWRNHVRAAKAARARHRRDIVGATSRNPPFSLGSLPAPLSTPPTSPLVGLRISDSAIAVIRKSQETPLHPPYQGDKGLRQANQKPRVEYWRELLAHIDAVYRKKFGRHYPWSNLARKNVWNLARGYSSWEVMALWDLYLGSESWWAVQTNWSVYGVIRDAGRLLDDARFNQLAVKHEEQLAIRRFGHYARPNDVIGRLRKHVSGFRDFSLLTH